MFFSIVTKNSNQEISTKNLVNLVKDEKFEYYEDSLENPIFRGNS